MRDLRPFWEKVNQSQPEGCWPWTGYIGPSGHGRTQHKYTSILASRKAWVLTHGEVRGGLSVLHTCDNQLCCNPAHMYLGTRADNMIDRWQNTPAAERGQRNRRSVMTEERIMEVVTERAKGATLVELANKFRVHKQTIFRKLKERADQVAEIRNSISTAKAMDEKESATHGRKK